MYRKQRYKILSVALPVLGSAILLISCGGKKGADDSVQENILTGRSDSMVRYETENGVLTSRYYTPMMEEYRYAPEPYREFRHGVDIVSYDSLGQVKSTLVGNYAINFTNLKLWEVRGSVRATSNEGRALETEQLYWNEATGRIYSNVDTDLFLGEDIVRGQGFESDQNMKYWVFRKGHGTFRIDTEPTRDSTSVARDSLATDGIPLPEGEGMPADDNTGGE